MAATFRPAARRAAFLRVLLLAPSKGGKTYTATALAHHLAALAGVEPTAIGVIDAETIGEGDAAVSRSELLEGDTCRCSRCNGHGIRFQGHNVARLPASHRSPRDYVETMLGARAAKYPILVVDGITPEWEWCLQEVDRLDDRNKAARWGKVTPLHDAFMRAMADYPGHLIVTCRVKDKIELPEGGGKPINLGLQPIQRDQLEYEFDFVLKLHRAHASVESRVSDLAGRSFDRPGLDLAEALWGWARGGNEAEAKRRALLEETMKLVVELPPEPQAVAREWLGKNGGHPGNVEKMRDRLRKERDERAAQPPAPAPVAAPVDAPGGGSTPPPGAEETKAPAMKRPGKKEA